jgi:hypothetical protein
MAKGSASLRADERTVSELKVAKAHQSCVQDRDCTVFSLECSCDCGQPINDRFFGEYLTAKVDRCKTYSGRLCKRKYPGQEV